MAVSTLAVLAGAGLAVLELPVRLILLPVGDGGTATALLPGVEAGAGDGRDAHEGIRQCGGVLGQTLAIADGNTRVGDGEDAARHAAALDDVVVMVVVVVVIVVVMVIVIVVVVVRARLAALARFEDCIAGFDLDVAGLERVDIARNSH